MHCLKSGLYIKTHFAPEWRPQKIFCTNHIHEEYWLPTGSDISNHLHNQPWIKLPGLNIRIKGHIWLSLIKLIVPTPLEGGGTICSTVFFVQTILTDQYIHRTQFWAVSLKSPSSAEYGIKKIFWNSFCERVFVV